MSPARCEVLSKKIETGEIKSTFIDVPVGKKHEFGNCVVEGTETGFTILYPNGMNEQVGYDDIDEHESRDNERCFVVPATTDAPATTVYVEAVEKV
jgi:hypothetical protein